MCGKICKVGVRDLEEGMDKDMHPSSKHHQTQCIHMKPYFKTWICQPPPTANLQKPTSNYQHIYSLWLCAPAARRGAQGGGPRGRCHGEGEREGGQHQTRVMPRMTSIPSIPPSRTRTSPRELVRRTRRTASSSTTDTSLRTRVFMTARWAALAGQRTRGTASRVRIREHPGCPTQRQ